MANMKNGRADTRGKKRAKNPNAPKEGAKPPEWKEHLSSYKELQLLRFENNQQLEAAIELLGPMTCDFCLMILPTESPSSFHWKRLSTSPALA